ncbi:DGQHR domain-containing protein [Carnobacterium maltaromaticum]
MENIDEIVLPHSILVEQGKNNDYDFLLSVLDAKTIIEYSNTIRLSEDPDNGVQRFLDMNRVKNIANYCKTENVIFPTPIILSLNSDFLVEKDSRQEIILNKQMINELGNPFSIIDGQHRIEGIKWYYKNNPEETNKIIQLPIIVYKDADQSKAAKIFVTINANQRKVDDSTIHELFGIIYRNSDRYTVQSFSNEVTKLLNETEYSPFYLSIKMLGKKQTKDQFISQGTIAKKITERITTNVEEDNLRIEKGKSLKPKFDKIFRDFFIDNNPVLVAKLMINFFSAFAKVFSSVWVREKGVMTMKAIGFSALMKLLDHIYNSTDNLSEKDFELYFEQLKEGYDSEITNLFTSSASSESVANEMAKSLIDYFKKSVSL